MIEDHCIENDIINEVEEKPTAETAEVLTLKLEFEREEWRLVHDEAQRAPEETQKAGDAEKAARKES